MRLLEQIYVLLSPFSLWILTMQAVYEMGSNPMFY